MHSAVLLLSFLLSVVESYSFEELLQLKCDHFPYRTQFKDMTCSISTSRTVDCTPFLFYDGKLKTRLEGDDGKICTISWENICGRDTSTEEFCYKVVANKKNFWDAAEDCTNQGYSLFSPHSDRQLQFFWEIVRSYSEQEFWTGVGTYRNQWIFHDRSTADFFRLNPKYDFGQSDTLALIFTSKSWSHAYLGYTRVVPAADLYPYVCVRNGTNPYVIPTEPEKFPEETTTSTSTTTTTSTTAKPSCPGWDACGPCPSWGGTWSDWELAPNETGFDGCGACWLANFVRTCMNGTDCPCQGPSTAKAHVNIGVCYYPRLSCCPGTKHSIVAGLHVCAPYKSLPPVSAPPNPTNCPPDPLWGDWGNWSSCKASCGVCGRRHRSKICETAAQGCPCKNLVGEGFEVRAMQTCTAPNCPGPDPCLPS